MDAKELAYTRGLARGKNLATSTISSPSYWHDNARGVAKLLGWPMQQVVDKVVAYHQERLEAVPDLTTYPELKGWREVLEAKYKGMRAAGNDDETIALAESFNFWRDVKLMQETGRAWHAAPKPEKCRVVYVPESDRGQLHAKNVDDPLTYWKPRPPYTQGEPWPMGGPLFFDGVGSGLHIDEAPPEIFPFDAREYAIDTCTTLEQAEEFLLRYNYFWSSQNLLVHDWEGNSVAFEKTRCKVARRGPNSQGINFITGMGALDPEISAHQDAMRQKYLDLTGQDDSCADAAFWRICKAKWRNMARYIDELSINPTFDNLKTLMEQRDPSGPMCLTGTPCHPTDEAPGCTLVMDIWLCDEKKLHRRQWRGEVPAWLDTPEIVEFS